MSGTSGDDPNGDNGRNDVEHKGGDESEEACEGGPYTKSSVNDVRGESKEAGEGGL